MRPGARVQAAIEILEDLAARRRPAAEAVKDWMLSHRFAGAKDRAAIGDLVFGALRWKASSAWRLQADAPRAWALGALVWGFGAAPASLAAMFAGDPHAPAPATAEELALFETACLDGAPAWAAGDYPEWLDASLAEAFGDRRGLEGAALAAPAPLDLRTNRLKADRDALIAELSDNPKLVQPPQVCPYSPDGVRIAWAPGRSFPYETDRAFLKGWFEVQDEGSQLAASLAGAQPGWQAADVCAGGGGKTLALAAAMANTGQIHAYDVEAARIAPLYERARRAGVRNLQIHTARRSAPDPLAAIAGRMDLALVDAPCSGSGTWRRAPDAKWRIRPGALAKRLEEQQAALDLGAAVVKPGGRLVYITCSVLPEENAGAIARFLERTGDFAPAPLAPAAPHHKAGPGVLFTPLITGCDGFFVCVLTKSG